MMTMRMFSATGLPPPWRCSSCLTRSSRPETTSWRRLNSLSMTPILAVGSRLCGSEAQGVEEKVFDAKLIDRNWRGRARDRGGVGICERWSEEEVIEALNETARNEQE